jgi:hypothetical protein
MAVKQDRTRVSPVASGAGWQHRDGYIADYSQCYSPRTYSISLDNAEGS